MKKTHVKETIVELSAMQVRNFIRFAGMAPLSGEGFVEFSFQLCRKDEYKQCTAAFTHAHLDEVLIQE